MLDLLKSLWDRAVSEGGVVSGAPLLFAAAVVFATAISGLSIWAVVSWGYSQRFEGQASTLSSLEGRLKLKDDQIADYKDKLSGATPLEAKKRIEALELQVTALSPRRLSVDQKEKISRVLAGAPGVVSIGSDMAVADAKPLAADLAAAFQAAGWRVSMPMFMGLGDPPPSGVGVRVVDTNQLNAVGRAVQAALAGANVSFDLRSGLHPQQYPAPGMPQTDIEIEITNKSN